MKSAQYLRKSAYITALPFVILFGGLLGKLLAERLYRLSEQSELNRYAQSLMDRSYAVAEVAQIALLKANSSPYPKCASDDMVYQRTILFETPYIKDVGRLNAGQLVCSTLLGPIPTPHRRATADIESADGTFVYGFGDLSTPETKGVVVGRGDANIVLAAATFDRFHTEKYNFSVYLQSENSNQQAVLFEFNDSQSPKSPGYDDHSGGERSTITKCENLFSEISLCLSAEAAGNTRRWYEQPGIILSAIAGMLLALSSFLLMEVCRSRNQNLLTRLNKAMDSKDLYLAYQPIVLLSSSQTVAFEALLRWEITKGDFVPPDVFIAKAEEGGAITRLTQYVIDRLIEDMGDFLVKNRDFRININVSAGDLERNVFINDLETKLAKANILPSQIGIELTERAPISSKSVETAIQSLSNKGHQIYIDDFGTGYSSISYLNRLKVDAVKIDKSFTRALSKGSDIPSVIPQILSIAKKFELSVVVEGIEHVEQAQYLALLDDSLCGQGWHYGRPERGETVIRNYVAEIEMARSLSQRD